MVSTVELPVFRLAELVNEYTLSTRCLEDRILFQTSAFEEHKKDVMSFWPSKKIFANALQKTQKEDNDDEALHLAKAASIVRNNLRSCSIFVSL